MGWCFPAAAHGPLRRLARVRLAAEAFSYLTLRGIAGEPLKVVLLGDMVEPADATAAVALERLAYLVGTTMIVGIGSVLAMAMLPLTAVWFRVFRAFAIVGRRVTGVLTAIVDQRAAAPTSQSLRRGASIGAFGHRAIAERPFRRGSSPRSSGRCSSSCAATRAPRGAAPRDDRGLRLHGARGVGDSARGRAATSR